MKRFWEKVNKKRKCWEWTASTYDGYGMFRFGKDIFRAHRFSYELKNGRIPEGLYVLHRCDNRRCVNPRHLYLGTHLDNMRDKRERGRGRTSDRHGENHHRAKLTNSTVKEIRKLYATGRYLQRELADKFGVQRRAIGRVLDGTRWSHV